MFDSIVFHAIAVWAENLGSAERSEFDKVRHDIGNLLDTVDMLWIYLFVTLYLKVWIGLIWRMKAVLRMSL